MKQNRNFISIQKQRQKNGLEEHQKMFIMVNIFSALHFSVMAF